MCLDNLLHNGKTETRATLPISHLLSEMDPPDRSDQRDAAALPWDADACIGDGDFDFRPGLNSVKK